MKKVLLTVGLFLSVFAQAQNYVHQAIILNEGYFDYQTNEILVPVTIGSYNPANQSYQVVDTLEGMRFGSDVLIDGNFYYVAADSKIFKMDLNTHQELASANCPGVRNLGIYQNKLIATRGEYLTTYDSYLHVYDATNLSLIAALDTVQGPKWAAQNIVVDGSSAYIAVNNAYEWGNEKGIIGKLDLNNLTYGSEVDLGPDGKNPDNMFASNGIIYTVNNKDWSGASVSKLPIGSTIPTTTNISSAITGCGTSALRDDKLVYQISMESTLNEFDLSLMNNVGPLSGHTINYYELAQEPISGNLYASETDYFSFGKVHLFDAQNNELSNFDAGVSPGTIVFDVRPLSSSLNELSKTISLYPNPTSDLIHISGAGNKTIYDLSGKIVIESSSEEISVAHLLSGAYILEMNGAKAFFVKK
ncbi:MAG: hypothetical protein RLZ10_550 [Bacteroidota bacterium]|jgi:hypothetical protein